MLPSASLDTPLDNSSVLSLQEISKTFKRGEASVPALQDVSVELKAGEFVALCGPSGSGKSTLLSIAGLTESPSGGEAFLLGERVPFSDLSRLTEIRREKIGFVFQYFNLLSSLSALENIATTLLLNSVSWGEARVRAAQLLSELGLSSRANHLPEELSGGEMQRVALARAIAHRPALLLADEPTGNLDSTTGEVVLSILRSIAKQGTAVLMVTHSERAAAHCDRSLYLLDGKLL